MPRGIAWSEPTGRSQREPANGACSKLRRSPFMASGWCCRRRDSTISTRHNGHHDCYEILRHPFYGTGYRTARRRTTRGIADGSHAEQNLRRKWSQPGSNRRPPACKTGAQAAKKSSFCLQIRGILAPGRFTETGWFRLNSAGFRPTDGRMGLNVLKPPTSPITSSNPRRAARHEITQVVRAR
jgi:hypothetical protein